MIYKKQIEALTREMKLDIRFTEKAYQELQGISCPNHDNKEYLSSQYEKLMTSLFSFLEKSPDKELIEDFVIQQIDEFKFQDLEKKEHHQLMLCYTGSLYFILDLKRARTHYEKSLNN